jgi:membrane protease subunit HflC
MARYAWSVLLLLLGSLWFLWACVFTVDRSEFVYLTTLGAHAATYDGASPREAGLHFRWPWPVQDVRRVDRRLQVLELPGIEQLTRDAQRDAIDRTLTIDAYMLWRVADGQGVDRLLRAAGGLDEARQLLAQRLGGELGAACGKLQMDDLINAKEPERVRRERDKLRANLMEALGKPALEQYGVEVVDIRLRRVSYPGQVRQAIFDRIISERERKAAEYQSQGEQEAAKIRADADREIGQMRGKAEAEAVRMKGQSEAEADRVRNEAQQKDPAFYTFLRKLEEYQRVLGDGKSTLLLSTHRELFDSLLNPPAPGAKPPAASPPAGGGK